MLTRMTKSLTVEPRTAKLRRRRCNDPPDYIQLDHVYDVQERLPGNSQLELSNCQMCQSDRCCIGAYASPLPQQPGTI